VRGLLPTPYFASGEALGTTKETGDRYRPLLRTHCEKFASGRCISADLRNPQELKGIRTEKPLRRRSVNTSHSVGVWSLFDRYEHRRCTESEMVTERCADQWNRRGLPRGSGESRAKRSATGPAGPWILLAREAEGLLRQAAG